MDPEKVDAILKWPHSCNLQELQMFLGLAGFYRKYIRDYAKIVVPMMNQSKSQGKSFTWGSKQQSSFEKLKVAIATASVLVVVDPHEPFVVETDASASAVGAVLLQDGRQVAFESKKLNNVQHNYSAYERKLYAIFHALKKWRHYLYGATFDVLFYEESIKWFTGQKDLKGPKARWAKVLQDFDCNLRYRKG